MATNRESELTDLKLYFALILNVWQVNKVTRVTSHIVGRIGRENSTAAKGEE